MPAKLAGMASIQDCAILAEDVYNQTGENPNELASRAGWERLDGQSWPDGFAAGYYRRGDEYIVSYRGTDDLADALADAEMIPQASDEQFGGTLPSVLGAYGLGDVAELRLGGAALARLLSSDDVRTLIDRYGNRVPQQQTQQAIRYLEQLSTPPAYLVGHSLGGALAKTLSLERQIACVGFNSPYMGDLQGTVPVTSALVLSVNTIGDPLSLATQSVGNLGHGRVELVTVAPMANGPPARPQMAEYRRPNICARGSARPLVSAEAVMAAAAGAVCETMVDVWEPIGRALSSPQRLLEFIGRHPRYYRALGNYLKDAALHHHSIVNLRQAVQADRTYAARLRLGVGANN
ncbi:MAG: hypothetical protein HKN49_00625 [Gammaproteobacteria bacterium]|nr:hypothetical protein [Gammaproteobacteria bacterium]